MLHTSAPFLVRRFVSFACPVVVLTAAIAATSAAPGQPAAADKKRQEAPAKKESKPARRPIYNPKADAQAAIAAALKTANIDGKRVLITFGGNSSDSCYKLHDVFQADRDVAKVLLNEFVLVLVDTGTHQELFEHYVSKAGQRDIPFLTVLDADGKILRNQNATEFQDGSKDDAKKVKAFLEKWSLPARDAGTVLAEGLSQAKRESKRVLLHVGAPWCGWCRILDRFLYENGKLFEGDFVDLKIDQDRMTNAEQVIKRFRASDAGGIPWIAILDADGKSLATSDAPSGNIGYPYRPEEIKHFMQMLRKTIQHTTADQLATIEKKLNEERQRRESGNRNRPAQRSPKPST